jgi:hypothetical protein
MNISLSLLSSLSITPTNEALRNQFHTMAERYETRIKQIETHAPSPTAVEPPADNQRKEGKFMAINSFLLPASLTGAKNHFVDVGEGGRHFDLTLTQVTL